jgi:hypothetical protein
LVPNTFTDNRLLTGGLNLFGKRKQNNSELFFRETNCKRSSYRVPPSKSAPIVFEFGGEKVQVIDISSGGLSFKNKDFKSGATQPIEFLLPNKNVSIAPILAIIAIGKQNICHCQFCEIREDEYEAIHQYVLKRQKEIMQSKKRKK